MAPRTPQQHAQMMQRMQMQQQMQGTPMERQGSNMDNMSGPRSGSPNSGEAPSPKRQRLDGSMGQMQQRPGPPNHAQSQQVGLSTSSNPGTPGIDPAAYHQTENLLRQRGVDPASVDPQTILNLSQLPANNQAKSVEAYSSSIQQHMKQAMNKSAQGITPNPGMGQGSPMSMDNNPEFYAAAANGGRGPSLPPGMGMPGQAANAAAAAAGQGGTNGNHALQDYQMQLMLLEQQNKKRLLMARQEQDSMANPGMPGPGGFAQGMSPGGGGRGGDPSPNTGDMRGTPKMNKGMSPNGDMGGRGSPQPGMMNPGMVPEQLRAQVIASGQMMRPPSSHPMGQPGAPLTQEQMMLMRSQNGQMMPNGNWQPGQGPPMMPGQPGQGPPGPNMTPRQQPMGPPPAPPAGTNPSSPAQPPAPPTPSQATKAKPGSKEAKGKKVSLTITVGLFGSHLTHCRVRKVRRTRAPRRHQNQKRHLRLHLRRPSRQWHHNSFNHNQNKNLPNGQQPPNAQQPGQPPQNQQLPVQPPPPMMDQPFGNLEGDASAWTSVLLKAATCSITSTSTPS